MKNKAILFVLLFFAPSLYLSAVNVQGTYTTVVCNGSTAQKYDIVFIGDGFTAAEQNLFNQRVNDAVDALRNLAPYSDRMCALNIWRVNVLSSESGVDHPADGIFKNTELDCRYGNPSSGEAERCIRSDSPAKCYEAADFAPAYDAVFVLVNDTQWGGCAGSLVFSSISAGFAGIITHELGHKIGNLGDEYTCYVCDGSDDNRSYTGAEPSRVNLTKNTNRATTKWGALINAATPIPTTVNNPPGVVGLWEGGMYFARDIYRPQFNCHMRSTGAPFCTVCNDEMDRILSARCSYCELNPSSFFCIFRLPDRFEINWQRIWYIRFPFPPVCLTCPPDNLTLDYEVLFESVVNPGAEVRILDDRGEVIAKAGVREKGQALKVKFSGNRFSNYSIDLDTGEPQGDKLVLEPKFFVNGKQMK
jgi:hypothetical protein